MKKLLFVLVFVPMVCLGENKAINDLSLSDEQLKKFEERFKAEQNSEFNMSSPSTAINESSKKNITYGDIYKATNEYIENMSEELKGNAGVLKKDELIALINELSLKLDLMENLGEAKKFGIDKNTFELFKKYPYSILCNQKLMTISNGIASMALISKSLHWKDVLYINEKLTNHSLGLSEIYSAAIYSYIEYVNDNNSLVKK